MQLLVKVAMERQEMLPGLVYEARPVRGGYVPNALTSRRPPGAGGEEPDMEAAQSLTAAPVTPLPLGVGGPPSGNGDTPRAGGAAGSGRSSASPGTYLPPTAPLSSAAREGLATLIAAVSAASNRPVATSRMHRKPISGIRKPPHLAVLPWHAAGRNG